MCESRQVRDWAVTSIYVWLFSTLGRIGCYVLDNFPFTREQFTLMVERVLVPDSFICLKDDSENGWFLANRWGKLHEVNRSVEEVDEEDKTEEEENKHSDEDDTSGNITKETSKNSGGYQAQRATFDNNWQQLAAIIKGTNNMEPIMIACEKDIDTVTEEAINAIEGIIREKKI